MKRSLKRSLAYGVFYPLRYRLDLAAARRRRRQRALRVLIASDDLAPTSESQFDPLWRDRSFLLGRGVALDHKLMETALASGPRIGYDAVFAKLSFRTGKAAAIAAIGRLRTQYPGAGLIYFDGDDDCCVQWPELLSMVDLYVKKQVFADPGWYQRQFIGKSNLTDYVAREYGRSFAEDMIPHSGVVSPQEVHKIVAGWNIGADGKIAELLRRTRPAASCEKTNDVICRAAAGRDAWIYPLRGPINQALEPLLRAGRSVLLPSHRVDPDTYQEEMRRSRICVSPFGYGELCWRDFEAIAAGCLLVKPAMSHLRTEPNIFVPGQTYVPVRWDFGDLAETCERYLSDVPELVRIARNAYRELTDFYQSRGAIRRLFELLEAADVGVGTPQEGRSHAL